MLRAGPYRKGGRYHLFLLGGSPRPKAPRRIELVQKIRGGARDIGTGPEHGLGARLK
jgi:hypothetical protein